MNSQTSVVGVHYRVERKIGEGSFGIIFDGTNLLNSQPVAIKFESRKSDAPQLRDEYRTYKLLVGCPGVPSVYYFGQEALHNILVIDLLGPSMEDLFELCGRRFSVKTVAMTAKQMLARIQTIHERNLVYRDIKPDNFLIGRPGSKNPNMIYIVDFGMAKYYRDPKTKVHIPFRERKSLSGTARYMSINTHLGREQSRRDDLESLGHVFMYFLRGSLPWQGLRAANNKHKYEKISEKKQSTSIKELCAGFPSEFSRYLTYVRELGFDEEPNYEFMQDLFDQVLRNNGDINDGVYDWMLLNNGKGWESISNHSSVIAMQRNKKFSGFCARQHETSRANVNSRSRAYASNKTTRGSNANAYVSMPSPSGLVPPCPSRNSASAPLNLVQDRMGYGTYDPVSRMTPRHYHGKGHRGLLHNAQESREEEEKRGFWSAFCCCCSFGR
ncbi:CK1/CK1/CK1-G protein kinase Cki2 [Schizosaccharomyces japonicus yFS275]|uniref:non-specific serine/threonine protein kinase n=1 Tax=Schizosaccharomyces japonicus (strain yFS275 / FY16936) TaxID=402676 RepID=B6K5L2_SCHJY|nr:CK1/CK1/CK1-G protein kinase Cki2 [Schizosaccharomyces japonicus yFS275]EEB08816.1 CK1/CK1/CK1-G protein kinase Cki2 [Schizosaccharomyces japonicus yFS275]